MRKGIEQIRVSRYRKARQTEHEVRIQHRILQLRPLALQLGRHRFGGKRVQGVDKLVIHRQPHQMVETVIRHARFLAQGIRRRRQRRANHQRCQRIAQRRHFRHQRTANGQRAEIFIRQMPIERIRQIGDHHRTQTEQFDGVFQGFQIAGSQRGIHQHIDLTRTFTGLRTCGGGIGNQRGNNRFHRFGKAAFQTAREIGGRQSHHRNVGVFGVFLAEFARCHCHVTALGFCQTRGRHTDQ